jgi:hypothetical protein
VVCPVVSDKSAIVTRGAPESKANGAPASFLHLQSKQVTLAACLGVLGVPAEDRDGLIDKLLDYLDADSFRRLNGAEAPEYLEAGLTVWPRLTSIAPVAGFNVNTAPRPLLC